MNVPELVAYIQDTYGTRPEHLWEKYPDTFIFRHRDNRKWFAVVMDVERSKLGLPGTGMVSLLDVKCGSLLSGSYIGKTGIVRAWHMNKSQWLGVLLDGSAEEQIVRELLQISYGLTERK